MKEVRKAFVKITRKNLWIITNMLALMEDTIFDRYKIPSIKHNEYM